MRRAADLVAAMERTGRGVMTEGVERLLSPAEVEAVVTEAMRREIAAMLVREEAFETRTLTEADAALARLEAEVAELRTALRLRDPTPAVEPARVAAAALDMALTPASERPAARPVLGALIEAREAERAVEDGHTVEDATETIRERRFGGRPAAELRPPVMLSAAVAKAVGDAVSAEMRRKIEATGALMLAHFGDRFVSAVFGKDAMVDFPLRLERVPRDHGKGHGRNRFESVGRDVSKHEVPQDRFPDGSGAPACWRRVAKVARSA